MLAGRPIDLPNAAAKRFPPVLREANGWPAIWGGGPEVSETTAAGAPASTPGSVRLQIDGRVATLELDRPGKLNRASSLCRKLLNLTLESFILKEGIETAPSVFLLRSYFHYSWFSSILMFLDYRAAVLAR